MCNENAMHVDFIFWFVIPIFVVCMYVLGKRVDIHTSCHEQPLGKLDGSSSIQRGAHRAVRAVLTKAINHGNKFYE